MDIFFTCDKCGKKLIIDEAGAGITIDCPECGNPVYVPSNPAPSRQDTPVRVEIKSTKPKSPFIPAPVTSKYPLVPPASVQEKSTIHPSIEAGVHCLLILVGILFVGYMLMREDIFWGYPVMVVAMVFGTAAFLCAVYGMCNGHVRQGLLILAGLSLIFVVSYRVSLSMAMGFAQRGAEEIQRQTQQQMQQMLKQFQK